MAIVCPTCKARNAPDAAYCLQCMGTFGPLLLPNPPQRFVTGSPASLTPQAGLVPPPPPTGDGVAPPLSEKPGDVASSPKHVTAPSLPPAINPALSSTQVTDDGVHIVDGQPVWQCQECEHIQPLTTFECEQCGTRFGKEKKDPVVISTLKTKERYFPGFGFFLAGHFGAAITRVIIAAGWLGTAIILGIQHPLVAIPLLFGVGIIWVTGPNDLEATLMEMEPFLNPKRLLYVVSGVLLAFILVGALTFYLGTSGVAQ